MSSHNSMRSRLPGSSAIYLPRLDIPPATIFEYLTGHFSHVGPDIWRRRIVDGKVMNDAGEAIGLETPYTPHITIIYFREVDDEEIIPFEEHILFRNEHFLIADKPHFLPVVPSGPYVNESLLFRLRRRTGLEAIIPVHRLDRETAGLVLFSLDPNTRSLYHRLFAEGAIAKEYLAVGEGEKILENEFTITNRVVPGEPWFRMRIDEGRANAITHVRVIGRNGNRVVFHLRPMTGKKHQLRLHLLSAGYPILNDRLYPILHPQAPYDYRAPLQLLAHRLSFIDPVSGRPMEFTSAQQLQL